MQHIHSFVMALALLTRIPLPNGLFPQTITPTIKTLSVLYYPLVGAVISCILMGTIKLLTGNATPAFFTSIVVVAMWVVITGALHLDGLADSLDAWAASHKADMTPNSILAVFKDPAAGPSGVAAIILIILLKTAALAALIKSGELGVLLLALVLARLIAVFYMASTTYVSTGGMAQDISLSLKSKSLYLQTTLILALGLFFWDISPMLISLILTGCILYFWRQFWGRKIKGYVGDCVGALIEFIEMSVLFVFVVF